MRDAIPAARLPEDRVPRAVARSHVPRAGGISLFLDRADHDDLPAGNRAGLRRRVDERRQGPFGVHRTPAVKDSIFHAHGDFAGDRIDMAEQNDLTRAIADRSDRVARFVGARGWKAKAAHSPDQPGDGLRFMLRRAETLDKSL